MPDPHTHGVLFDAGYGLLSEEARLEAAIDSLRDALLEHGYRFTAEAMHQQYQQACLEPRQGIGGLCVQTMLALGVDDELAQQLRRELPWDAAPMTPLPGAAEALQKLHDAGLRVGVLANQPPSAADDLERCGLTELLDGIWLSDVVGLMKPDPAFFQLALDAWGMPPPRVAYVGDRPDNDVEPVKKLGMHTVRLMLGPHADQPALNDDQRADFEADSLAEAAAHLIQWARSDV